MNRRTLLQALPAAGLLSAVPWTVRAQDELARANEELGS